MEQQELSYIAGGNTKWYSHSGKQFGDFLTKLNILLLYDPEITRLDIYPKELKIYAHTKTSTWMFIAVLFIIAKT